MSRKTLASLSMENVALDGEGDGSDLAVAEAMAETTELTAGAVDDGIKIDETSTAIDDGVDGIDGIDEQIEVMEETLESGGIDETGAKLVNVSVERICRDLGFTKAQMPQLFTMPSMEAFAAGNKTTRLAATKLAIESAEEGKGKIWDRVKEAAVKLWEMIKNFVVGLFSKTQAVINTAKAIEKAADAVKAEAAAGTTIEPGNWANLLHYKGKFMSAEYTSKTKTFLNKLTDATKIPDAGYLEGLTAKGGVAADMIEKMAVLDGPAGYYVKYIDQFIFAGGQHDAAALTTCTDKKVPVLSLKEILAVTAKVTGDVEYIKNLKETFAKGTTVKFDWRKDKDLNVSELARLYKGSIATMGKFCPTFVVRHLAAELAYAKASLAAHKKAD